MAKPMKAKFVVEVAATAEFSIEFAISDIEKLLKELKLYGRGYYEKPIVEMVTVKSYNRLHRRKLLQPAKYSPRE
jgi:hypothetical protein